MSNLIAALRRCAAGARRSKKHRMRCSRSACSATASRSIRPAIRCTLPATAKSSPSRRRSTQSRSGRTTARRFCCTSASIRLRCGGEGFRCAGRSRARGCAAGDPLLRFDLDLLARAREESDHARSSSPTAIALRSCSAQRDRSVEVGDALIELQPVERLDSRSADRGAAGVTETLTVLHEHGIHARPAALIANFAKGVGRGDHDRRAWPHRQREKRSRVDVAGRSAWR